MSARRAIPRTRKTRSADTKSEANPSFPFDERAWEALAARARYDFATFRRLSRRSPRQLQRIFSARFNYGPEEWLRRLKLRLASERLRADDNIKTIVIDLNLFSASYFGREFKERYGVPPMKYYRLALLSPGE